MCGIVGYIGDGEAVPVLLDALSRLEYRGYDSAGIACLDDGVLAVAKRAGKVADLAASVTIPVRSGSGIGHTRWATHGAPSEVNAHPHLDCTGNVAIIHNGIIENYREIESRLAGTGHEFASDTDSELLAHLVESHLGAGATLADAARLTLGEVEGSVAMVVISSDHPEALVAVRRDSPLIIGMGDGENLLASDIPALLGRTRRIVIMEDGQVAEVSAGAVRLFDGTGAELETVVREIEWDLESPEREGFPDYMLKEIHEQPRAVRDTVRARLSEGRLVLDHVRMDEAELLDADKVVVVACGSSFHAGLVAKYAIEHWARLPVEIDIASEFRYRDPVLTSETLVIGISQSGETLDTVAACRYAKRLHAKVIAVCNVVDSSMAREADAVLYTRAGPEVGVCATKTFTAQMAAMELIALYLAQVRGTLYPNEVAEIVSRIGGLPAEIERMLPHWRLQAEEAAEAFQDARDFFFLGRGVGYPVAMEGALKLKEISYLRAEGYPAGEMKHGPIALIEPGVVVVVVATKSHVQAKLLSNLQEMKARGATIVVVAADGDEAALRDADFAFTVPEADELLSPLLDIVPLQLFAYEIAKARGLNVDKPRNLAKTVTVE